MSMGIKAVRAVQTARAFSKPFKIRPVVCSLPGSSVHGLFPGKSTGVGCHCYYIRILRGPVHTHGFRVHVLSNAMLTVNMQFPISNIRSIYWLTIVICILF